LNEKDFMKNLLIFIFLLIFLSACGVKSVTSSSVQAEIVSVAEYKDYSCKELALDALNIQNKIPEISSVIDKKKKDNDAYIATAVVFMPILAAGIKGNQEEAAQLALYKGQLNAIRQVAIMKDCEIIQN
tara:strand:- start:266 stop:652 length:387 start_codon:yes stop_codon:yes gene_type:complete